MRWYVLAALWVAAYRAEETARPDALFRDPLAATLAGERGKTIAASMPSARSLAFAMTIRTVPRVNFFFYFIVFF